jgi:hypothetical protein
MMSEALGAARLALPGNVVYLAPEKARLSENGE